MRLIIAFALGFAAHWYFYPATVIEQTVIEHQGTHWCHPVATSTVAWKGPYYYYAEEPRTTFFIYRQNKLLTFVPCDP